MVPALKPAVLETETGIVGVLATPTTMQGKLLRDVMAQWQTEDVRVVEQIGAGLVELVEAGAWDGDEARRLLKEHLGVMVALGADHVVLGCTHYPYLGPVIREIAPALKIMDAAPAVARQVERVLEMKGLAASDGHGTRSVRYATTGGVDAFRGLLARLGVPDGEVEPGTVTLADRASPVRSAWHAAAVPRRRSQ
jgi:glutamate racemase